MYLIIIVLGVSYYGVKSQTFSYDTMEIIAHAGGGIEEVEFDYLNSLEGFLEQYEKGTRTFEFDFAFSSDDELILVHKFDDAVYLGEYVDYIPTLEEFEEHKLLLTYNTLSIYDLRNLMIEYPDIKIIIDTKELDVIRVYQKLEEIMIEDIYLNRIIPQIYDTEMLSDLEEIYNFEHYIFTLYKYDGDLFDAIKEAREIDKIDIITININELDDIELLFALYLSGKDIYVHTVDDKLDTMLLYFSNIDGIYTNKISAE
jgi:glycerophosphoryl diester phosphodiesterase